MSPLPSDLYMAGSPFLRPGEALRDLQTLEAIEERPDISQRDLAARLGVAVGLTNACLRKMARKGWIKIRRVNSRNISYHLTRAGIAEKARLSIEFTEATIGFYRQAKQTVSQTLGLLETLGVTRVLVLGATDLAEIVAICSPAYGVEIVAIVDGSDEGQERSILGSSPIPVEMVPDDGFDALVVADAESYAGQPALFQELARGRYVVWPAEGRIDRIEEAGSE